MKHSQHPHKILTPSATLIPRHILQGECEWADRNSVTLEFREYPCNYATSKLAKYNFKYNGSSYIRKPANQSNEVIL